MGWRIAWLYSTSLPPPWQWRPRLPEPARLRLPRRFSFLVDDAAVLIVAAGDAKVNSSKFKAKFHAKAKMIPADRVEELVGHAPGGVCPFAVCVGVPVYLDESLRRFEYVYPACGSSNSAVRLTPAELERASGCVEWVDVCRLPEAMQ